MMHEIKEERGCNFRVPNHNNWKAIDLIKVCEMSVNLRRERNESRREIRLLISNVKKREERENVKKLTYRNANRRINGNSAKMKEGSKSSMWEMAILSTILVEDEAGISNISKEMKSLLKSESVRLVKEHSCKLARWRERHKSKKGNQNENMKKNNKLNTYLLKWWNKIGASISSISWPLWRLWK